MPMLRGYSRGGPFRYHHWLAARELAQGKRRVTENSDTSEFRFRSRKPDPEEEEGPRGLTMHDGDLLAYEWKPMYALIAGIGLGVFLWGLGSLYYYLSDVGRIWGWQALSMIPIGFWMLIWYPFQSGASRYVIFDRRNNLVHIARWFSRKMDAVRFQDATILIIDVPGGYMGMDPHTCVYVGCPGWSLWKGEYPPRYARRDLSGLGVDIEDDDVERSWGRILDFMNKERANVPWLNSQDDLCASSVEFRYGGDWTAMRKSEAEQMKCRSFYGLELLTEPNWICGEGGAWQYVGEGPRERIVLPDGPEDKRVPVEDDGAPTWKRWGRTVYRKWQELDDL